MNKQLDDFYNHLHNAVKTSNNFERDGTKFRKREKVFEFAYCALNEVFRQYLSFDLDDPPTPCVFRYEDVGLPPPTIITINPVNAHCHYLYQLKTPVAYHDQSHEKPQAFFEGIQNAMTHSLKADISFAHAMTKNPLHPKWKVITNPAIYELSDFLEYKLPHRPDKPLSADLNVRGRNDQLFHTLRLWGYRAVQDFSSRDRWFLEAHDKATVINSGFTNPLPYAEVRDTAKATAKWIWKNRHSFGNRTKVLEFSNETAQERMSLGADYTNAVRTAKAIESLRRAAATLRLSGKPVTPLSMQVVSGLNIKTVRKYFHHIGL